MGKEKMRVSIIVIILDIIIIIMMKVWGKKKEEEKKKKKYVRKVRKDFTEKRTPYFSPYF